jgi:uncharacterized protein YkwD
MNCKRFPHPVLPLLLTMMALSVGCGSSDQNESVLFITEPVGTAGAMDTTCIAETQNQGCHGQSQMWCDNTSKTWQVLGSCGSGTQCTELPDPTLPGALIASCEKVASPAADAGASSGGGTSGGTSGASSGGGVQLSVCARWLKDRDNLAEGKWTGNAATCKPGTFDDESKDHALKLVNLYRFLAHMPQVTRNPGFDTKAQACALIMRANGKLSHTPSKNWKCWTEAGALAAKKSNISTGPGVRSVDRYMVDNGANNAATLGHRRWILSRSLDKIGIGSTPKGSCLWVIGGKGKSPRKWIAWPNDGEIPLAAFGQGGGSIDQTGWSLQSNTISFTGAKITVRVDGKVWPIKQRSLKPNYGSKFAVAWTPSGWKTEAGVTYKVSVTDATVDFSYSVKVLACGLK